MKVVLSASACAPHRGSEPGTGWQWAEAAARRHDVWLLTPTRNREAIDAEIAARDDLGRLHPVYVDEPRWIPTDETALRFRRLRYLAWQRRAGAAARRLHAEHGIDVAHHVTFAADWQPCGLTALDEVPLVWGPVGGATRPVWSLWRHLGARGLLEEVARSVLTGTGRLLVGRRVARRAAVTVAMNPDVVEALGDAPRRVVVESHVAIDPNVLSHAAPRPDGSPQGPRTAVFVGRLIGWKGIHLAVEAIARPELADWRLVIFGRGPLEEQLRRRATELGVGDRVDLPGYLPRDGVLDAVARADALVFPSLHDSGGWAVGEAITLGCPVVCLDRGGPALLAGAVGDAVVPVSGRVVEDLAAAWAAVAPRRAPSRRWTADRLPDVIDDLYAAATSADVGVSEPAAPPPKRDLARLIGRNRAFLGTSDAVAALVRRRITARAMPADELLAADRVLVLAPHPDDETLACGGTIARLRDAGAEVDIVVATDGSGSHHSEVLTPSDLAEIRRAELCQAAKLLGVDADRVVWLGHRDQHLAEHLDAVRDALSAFVGERDPDVVLVPSAVDRNPDHRALHRAATDVITRPGGPAVYEYPVWFWHPETWIDRSSSTAAKVGQLLRFPRRATTHAEAVRVDVRGHLQTKREAIAAHRSQTTNLTGEDDWAVISERFLGHFLDGDEVFFRPAPLDR